MDVKGCISKVFKHNYISVIVQTENVLYAGLHLFQMRDIAFPLWRHWFVNIRQITIDAKTTHLKSLMISLLNFIAWTFAARIGDKYQICLTQPISYWMCWSVNFLIQWASFCYKLIWCYWLSICIDASFFSMLFIFTELVFHIMKTFLEKNKSSINFIENLRLLLRAQCFSVSLGYYSCQPHIAKLSWKTSLVFSYYCQQKTIFYNYGAQIQVEAQISE